MRLLLTIAIIISIILNKKNTKKNKTPIENIKEKKINKSKNQYKAKTPTFSKVPYLYLSFQQPETYNTCRVRAGRGAREVEARSFRDHIRRFDKQPSG